MSPLRVATLPLLLLFVLGVPGCGPSSAKSLEELGKVAKIEQDPSTGGVSVVIVGHLPEALPHLKNVSKVTKLSIMATAGDDVVAQLAGLTELRTLGLRLDSVFQGDKWTPGMTDASFAHLRGMKHLQTLFVQSVESTDGKGFAHLAELPALEELVLGTDPTDGMLEHLQGCKQLKRLRLGDNCRFSDRGVAALRLLPVLEDLQVDCSNMDVRFALERLTKIKFGPLKADWLADLKALPQLKILRLPNGVDHRWKKGLDDLKAAKPALTVHFKAFNSL